MSVVDVMAKFVFMLRTFCTVVWRTTISSFVSKFDDPFYILLLFSPIMQFQREGPIITVIIIIIIIIIIEFV